MEIFSGLDVTYSADAGGVQTAPTEDCIFKVSKPSDSDILPVPSELEGKEITDTMDLTAVNTEVGTHLSEFVEILDFVNGGFVFPLLKIRSKECTSVEVETSTIEYFMLVPCGSTLITKEDKSKALITECELVAKINNGIFQMPLFYVQQSEVRVIHENRAARQASELSLETSRYIITSIISKIPLFCTKSDPFNFLVDLGKGYLDLLLKKREEESDEIAIMDVFEPLCKMRINNDPRCSSKLQKKNWEELLEDIDRCEPDREFVKNHVVFKSEIVYNNNPKRVKWVVPSVAFGDEERGDIILKLNSDKRNLLFPSSPDFVVVEKKNSLSGSLSYKLNTAEERLLIKGLSYPPKPKAETSESCRLTVAQVDFWYSASRSIFEQFNKEYERSTWVGKMSTVELLHSENVEFNDEINARMQSSNHFLESYRSEFSGVLKEYFNYACLYLQSLSRVASNIYCSDKDKRCFSVNYCKIPVLEGNKPARKANASLILNGYYQQGEAKRCKMMEVMIVTPQVKQILTSFNYMKLSYEYSVLNQVKPRFIPYKGGNFLYVRFFHTTNREQEPAFKYPTLIPITDGTLPDGVLRRDLQFVLLLSNTSLRRTSEETYYWVRYILMSPLRPICEYQAMRAELREKFTSEHISMGLLLFALRSCINSSLSPELRSFWVDMVFPYCGTLPWPSGEGGGTYNTLKHMLKGDTLGLKREELDSQFSADPNSKCNYGLWMKCITLYGTMSEDQVNSLRKNESINCSLDSFGAEGSKVCPLSFKITNPVVAMTNMPRVFGEGLCDTRGLLSRFGKLYLANRGFRLLKSEVDEVLYARLAGKPIPFAQCTDFVKTKNSHMKLLKEHIQIPFRKMARLMLCIIGTPKDNERAKSTARDIFVIPPILYFILKNIEAVFDIMMKEMDDHTIPDGVAEKVSKIHKEFNLVLNSTKTCAMGSWDETKYHTTMSVMLMISSAVKIIEATLDVIASKANRYTLMCCLDTLYAAAAFLFHKRILVPQLKMSIDQDGGRYHSDYLTDTTILTVPKGVYMMSAELLKQHPLDMEMLIVRLGEWGQGFCMGFCNRGGTFLRCLLNLMMPRIESILNLIWKTLHSSDDAITFHAYKAFHHLLQEISRATGENLSDVADMVFYDFHKSFARAVVALCKSMKKSALALNESEAQVAEFNTIFLAASKASKGNVYAREALSRDTQYGFKTGVFNPDKLVGINESTLTSKATCPKIHAKCMTWMLYNYCNMFGLLDDNYLEMFIEGKQVLGEFGCLTNWQLPRLFGIGPFALFSEMELRVLSSYINKDYAKVRRLAAICNPVNPYCMREALPNTTVADRRVAPLEGLKLEGIYRFQCEEARRNRKELVSKENLTLIKAIDLLDSALRSCEIHE